MINGAMILEYWICVSGKAALQTKFHLLRLLLLRLLLLVLRPSTFCGSSSHGFPGALGRRFVYFVNFRKTLPGMVSQVEDMILDLGGLHLSERNLLATDNGKVERLLFSFHSIE